MRLICQLLKKQAISLLITGLLIVQSIFAPEQYYLFAVILGLQLIRITWEYCRIPLYQIVPVLQYWSYLIILYYTTQHDVMACMCILQLGHLESFLLDLELRNRKLVILLQGGADIITFFLFLNSSQVYLPSITIAIKIIVQYLNQTSQQEQFTIDSNQIPSIRISQPQTPKSDPQQMELLSFFPQGITLIGMNDEILFCNENMKKIFQQGQQTIVQAIFSLEDQKVMEQMEKQSEEQQKPSVSSFSTFQPVPIPKTPFKSILRVNKASGTVIQQQLRDAPSQGFSLLRARTQNRQDTLKIQDTFITDCCIIESEIFFLKKQIQRKDVQNKMKNTNSRVQEHIAVMGYVHMEKQKRRQIEIKLYSCLINDTPSILIVARDITHRDYIRSLLNYSQQKSKMLSFVSHEYRNSLNCIIDQLNESLREENRFRSETIFSDKDKENFKHIRIALDTAKQLLSLSDDLLDLAQIRVGKFKARKKKFNLFNQLKNCLELFSVTAEKRQIMLSLNYGHQVPKIIEQDENRVKQIIVNLLGNAFKFTIKGSITIEVTQGQDSKRITVSVIDTGIGMSEVDQQNIFKAFGKGNSEESKKMNEKGVGLGLLISNQILQNLNGGDLQNGLKFNSQEKKGSTFYFSIQISDLQEALSLNCMEERNQESEDSEYKSQFVPEEEKIQQLKNVNKKINNNNIKGSTKVSIGDTKILVVDDMQYNVDMVVRMMKDQSVDWAINGFQAIQKCEEIWKQSQEFYKIILMDLEMPGMNGFEASKAIYELCAKLGTKTTIIGCSAYDSQDEINECLKSGMKGYLQKPVQPNALREILFKHL